MRPGLRLLAALGYGIALFVLTLWPPTVDDVAHADGTPVDARIEGGTTTTFFMVDVQVVDDRTNLWVHSGD